MFQETNQNLRKMEPISHQNLRKSTLGCPSVNLLTPWAARSLPKSVKLQRWDRWGAPWAPLGRQVGLKRASLITPGNEKSTFWPKWSPQGSNLEPWRCPGGLQNRTFG